MDFQLLRDRNKKISYNHKMAQATLEKYHEQWMRRALNLAERGLGMTAPNPAVGCIIVKNGTILGRGWTQKGGTPHAETEALSAAGKIAEGADIYTTLEPCCHHGKTAPCTDAIIAAKPARVICALKDPDRRVNGNGFKKLQEANIEVIENVLEEEASFLNAGYLLRVKKLRPLIALKTGSTLDGQIATKTGNSRWITNETSRAQAHALRSTYDAIIIGSRTALGDDPELTCRLSGLEDRTPIRIVADSHLSISLSSKLVQTATTNKLWILCRADADQLRSEALEQSGAKLFDIEVEPESGMMNVKSAAAMLASQGITRLLIEGGSHLSASFLRSRLIDRIYWFAAATIIGADGIPAIRGMGIEKLDELQQFKTLWNQKIGNDNFNMLERVL